MTQVTHGYGGNGVVEIQGWPDVMAAVVQNVWGLAMCLLRPVHVWGPSNCAGTMSGGALYV